MSYKLHTAREVYYLKIQINNMSASTISKNTQAKIHFTTLHESHKSPICRLWNALPDNINLPTSVQPVESAENTGQRRILVLNKYGIWVHYYSQITRYMFAITCVYWLHVSIISNWMHKTCIPFLTYHIMTRHINCLSCCSFVLGFFVTWNSIHIIHNYAEITWQRRIVVVDIRCNTLLLY